MYKLLRSTCLHCFHLKMSQKEVDKYTERLALLAQGKLTAAAAVTTGGGKAAETAKSFVEAGDGENGSGNVLKGKSMGQAKGAAPSPPLDGKPATTEAPAVTCSSLAIVNTLDWPILDSSQHCCRLVSM